MAAPRFASNDLSRLTPGERRVLEAIVTHGTIADVPAALGLAVRTVTNRLTDIHEKYGVHTTTEAVLIYMATARW